MKCFNHEIKDAVGQCNNCGKGLCKECFEEYSGMCKECYYKLSNENLDNAANDYYGALLDYRKSIITAIVYATICGIIFSIIMSSISDSKSDFGFMIFCFLIPFGWTTITRVIGKSPDAETTNTLAFLGVFSGTDAGTGFAIGTFLVWIIKVSIKLIISVFICIPCIVYLVYKLIDTNKKIKKLYVDYSEKKQTLENEEQ